MPSQQNFLCFRKSERNEEKKININRGINLDVLCMYKIQVYLVMQYDVLCF